MKKILIIAEAGVNHNGNINIAKKLIDAAVEAQTDYIKFQTFKAEKLVSKTALKASYQQKNTNAEESQQEMLKKLELTESGHLELIEYCKQKNIRFLSTAFDSDSIDMLRKLGVTLGKIPSGEITNLPYLKKMAETFPEIIMSTGMADMDEIAAAVNVLTSSGAKKENLILLHCNTEYPTPMYDVNLLAMKHIENELGLSVGYSDHTLGIEVPIAAVALGAVCIEKHFTLDRNMQGPDHKASLEPNELKEMVKAVRNIERALGSGIKTPSASELKNREIARKSIHVSRNLCEGHVLSQDDLVMKRPGSGISPMKLEEVIGKKLNKEMKPDDMLNPKDITI